jgi:NhaP-type Na+/H+ or K+/H+ antiporter
MSFLGWVFASGAVFLMMALSSAYLQRVPISTASIYLVLGILVGPIGFDVLRIELGDGASWLEPLTEIAVIVSLFVSGLKLRLHWRSRRWRTMLRLAGPLMLVTIAGVALFAHIALGLDVGLSLLIGAVLAPTDPVLASAVSVNDASDRDRMRHGLSGEAGLNDGIAFPFVILALQWMQHRAAGEWLVEWALHRLLWAIPAALLLGYFLGKGAGRLAIMLRARHQDTSAPSDFLALALIALSYACADIIGAWGFLAVFAAGVGLRRAEWSVVDEAPHPNSPKPEAGVPHPPAEELVSAKTSAEQLSEPAVAAGTLLAETISFGDTLERLLEVMLVVIVGVSLAAHWDARALPLAFALMFVLRPIAAHLVLLGTPTTRPQRWLMGWFGIRGIGSLYYVCYALNSGVDAAAASTTSDLTISIIALSVLMHGITAQPLLSRYKRSLAPAVGCRTEARAWTR